MKAFILILTPTVVIAQDAACLSSAGLAGVIFGSIAATLLASIGVAILLYYICRNKKGKSV
jgi:hypothetical protein